VKSLDFPCASAVVIHYEEALYQVYGPLPLPLRLAGTEMSPFWIFTGVKDDGSGE